MADPFSVLDRKKVLSRLRSDHYDLLVVGGGITGAGIALDAASRGLTVALVEKSDFAFGTSSRSTKLIHGGLRYLKQLEFGLVKEVGSERAVVHRLAPHLVVPEKMLLPLSEGKSLGYMLTSVGLMIYDWLAGVRKDDRRKMLTRLQTLRREPLLRKQGIKGGAIYAEYRTDDARLTLAVIKTAAHHGAVLLNYVRVTDFINQNGQVTGGVVVDELSGEQFAIKATAIVNATGPWVDEVRSFDNANRGKRLHLTKGVHIVVPRERLPVNQAIYFDAPDGRMIFAIPRGRTTYIGTTDTSYTGNRDEVFASRADVEYLLTAVTKTLQCSLSLHDVESSWAGLRPLIYEEGKTASALSRKDEIIESSTGLISIAGGKLTGYRKMAERVVDLVIRKFFVARKLSDCFTDKIKLAGNEFASFREVQVYRAALFKRITPFGFDSFTAHYLVENYGQQADYIVNLFCREPDHEYNPSLALLKAELLFSVQHEIIANLEDFFVRRTGLAYFDIHRVQSFKNEIASSLADMLAWSDEKRDTELRRLDGFLSRLTVFNE